MSETYCSHIGLHFTDTDGSKVTCVQLVDSAGYAVADATFRGVKCERFLAADSVQVEAERWLAGLFYARS